MAENEVLTTIKKRRSVRAFQENPITAEELQTVLEAARYAPSAGNQQLWHFTVIQDPQLLAELNVSAKAGAAQIDNEHIQQLGSCWVNLTLFAFLGEKDKQYKDKLGIPAGYKPFSSVVLGYKKVEAVNIPHRNEAVVDYIK